jgi:hypothetical protein
MYWAPHPSNQVSKRGQKHRQSPRIQHQRPQKSRPHFYSKPTQATALIPKKNLQPKQLSISPIPPLQTLKLHLKRHSSQSSRESEVMAPASWTKDPSKSREPHLPKLYPTLIHQHQQNPLNGNMQLQMEYPFILNYITTNQSESQTLPKHYDIYFTHCSIKANIVLPG